jgi:diadenosine tetraphosphate (Ap4A) HIT family hydrolase
MCIFCDKINKDNVLFETSERTAFFDEHPVSKGHTLLIPKKHFETYFDLPNSYTKTIDLAIKDLKKILDEKFHPDGYNIGFNCGETAGQSIMHFHIHIIPRYNGDVENPRGGIRGVIPAKQNY